MTRVALVGCGRWGANILRDLVASGVAVEVVEPDAGRAAYATAHGAQAVHGDLTTLHACDGVVIATPAPTHRQVVERSLDFGVPVFVEKPPCTSVDDVAALVAAGGDRVFVMHKWRYHPGVLEIGDVARSGVLGTPLTLHTTRVGPEPLPPDVDVVWHLGVHDVSIELSVLGRVGTAGPFTATHTADGRASACTGEIVVDEHVHHLQLGAGQPTRTRSIHLSGPEGEAALAAPESPVVTLHTNGRTTTRPLDTTPPLFAELTAFVAHLDGGPAPVSSLPDALQIVRCLDDVAQHCSPTGR